MAVTRKPMGEQWICFLCQMGSKNLHMMGTVGDADLEEGEYIQ